MWEKFRNWFFGRVLNRHRLLFRFWNGSRYVSSDPFVLLRSMLNTDKFDLEADMKALEIPEPKLVAKKIGHIAEGVREVFGVPPFEAGGLSELECVNLLLMFNEFLETVKKNGGQSLISSLSSANTRTAPSSAEKKGMSENLAST